MLMAARVYNMLQLMRESKYLNSQSRTVQLLNDDETTLEAAEVIEETLDAQTYYVEIGYSDILTSYGIWLPNRDGDENQ